MIFSQKAADNKLCTNIKVNWFVVFRHIYARQAGEDKKPSEAMVCLTGQWDFNRLLFVLLTVFHSFLRLPYKDGTRWAQRKDTDKTDNKGKGRIYHVGIK